MTTLARVARFPRLRALTWVQDILYASRGYELLRAKMPADEISDKYGMPYSDAESLYASLLIYSNFLAETKAESAKQAGG